MLKVLIANSYQEVANKTKQINNMENKYINTDWENPKSIKQSERQKTRLENQGYSLVHTFTSGSRFATLVFQK